MFPNVVYTLAAPFRAVKSFPLSPLPLSPGFLLGYLHSLLCAQKSSLSRDPSFTPVLSLSRQCEQLHPHPRSLAVLPEQPCISVTRPTLWDPEAPCYCLNVLGG